MSVYRRLERASLGSEFWSAFSLFITGVYLFLFYPTSRIGVIVWLELVRPWGAALAIIVGGTHLIAVSFSPTLKTIRIRKLAAAVSLPFWALWIYAIFTLGGTAIGITLLINVLLLVISIARRTYTY